MGKKKRKETTHSTPQSGKKNTYIYIYIYLMQHKAKHKTKAQILET